MKIILLSALLFTFLNFAPGNAMIVTLDLDELVASSDLIVIAQADKVELQEGAASETRIISNKLSLAETLKGTKDVSEVTFETLQGLEDEPVFVEGGRYLLFLKKLDDKLLINNSIQGSWPLDPENKPLGMGFGKTLEQIESVIKKQSEKLD